MNSLIEKNIEIVDIVNRTVAVESIDPRGILNPEKIFIQAKEISS